MAACFLKSQDQWLFFKLLGIHLYSEVISKWNCTRNSMCRVRAGKNIYQTISIFICWFSDYISKLFQRISILSARVSLKHGYDHQHYFPGEIGDRNIAEN